MQKPISTIEKKEAQEGNELSNLPQILADKKKPLPYINIMHTFMKVTNLTPVSTDLHLFLSQVGDSHRITSFVHSTDIDGFSHQHIYLLVMYKRPAL